MAYKKAPISELICGVTFNSSFLISHSILFDLLSTPSLKSEYGAFSMHSAIIEEELQDYKLFTNINIPASGSVLYRMTSSDQNYILQFQHNLVLLNWIRGDDQKVGLYPGFKAIYQKFKELFLLIEEKVKHYEPNLDIYRHVKSFTLYYQDRVFFNEYINDLSHIEDIVNLKTPIFPGQGDDKVPVNNIFSKYTVPVKEVNCYSIININTGTSPQVNQQVLIIECRINGKYEGGEKIDEWFKIAHDLQVKFFDTFFNPKLLDKWKE